MDESREENLSLFPDLSTRLLLLLLEESEETDTRHLGDLETHTGNITLGVAGATETSNEHLVLIKEERKGQRDAGCLMEAVAVRCHRIGGHADTHERELCSPKKDPRGREW